MYCQLEMAMHGNANSEFRGVFGTANSNWHCMAMQTLNGNAWQCKSGVCIAISIWQCKLGDGNACNANSEMAMHGNANSEFRGVSGNANSNWQCMAMQTPDWQCMAMQILIGNAWQCKSLELAL
jgi:hypothetical protein